MKSISSSFVLLLIYTCSVIAAPLEKSLVSAAIERTKQDIHYDGSYITIGYPNGDVPANTGVCTDLVIRSYRALGIDLQSLVHEDMKNNFNSYPSKQIWGLSKPDTNIDHRRVPNLQVFFSRNGEVKEITANPQDYMPGDLVTWMLPGNLPHIGIVIDKLSVDGKTPLIVHNIGAGVEIEDMLFKYEITGHYSFSAR